MRTVDPRESYLPGYNVHWIHAKEAMKDRDTWRAARLVSVSGAGLDIKLDGDVRRYYCYFAPEIKTALEQGSVRGGVRPEVVLIERWHIMMLPVNSKRSPQPVVISFGENPVRMDSASATEALPPESSYRNVMYNLSREPLT